MKDVEISIAGTVWVSNISANRDRKAYGFSSAEEPANTFLPLLSVTVVAFARLDPSFALNPATVTDSPTFRELRVHPRRSKPAGLVNSTSQLTTFPLLSFTSI